LKTYIQDESRTHLGKGWGDANCLKPKAELPYEAAWLFYLSKGGIMAVKILIKRKFKNGSM
jgi:hypothetical protein